jgi:hypothetical protein
MPPTTPKTLDDVCLRLRDLEESVDSIEERLQDVVTALVRIAKEICAHSSPSPASKHLNVVGEPANVQPAEPAEPAERTALNRRTPVPRS